MAQWRVIFHPEFRAEFAGLSQKVRDELAAVSGRVKRIGPHLGRPYVDGLKGSKHANMKEMRFDGDGGTWCVAFAFDPERKAIVLVAGDKTGTGQRRFYKALIAKADTRFDSHLAALRK